MTSVALIDGSLKPRVRRVALVAHSAYPSEPRTRRMAEALAEAGHDVTVICLRQPGQAAAETVNAVQVVRLPIVHRQGAGAAASVAEYGRFFWQAGALLRTLNRHAPIHLVQVHNPPDALAFCALPMKLRRVPLILDLRELTPELFMSRFALAREQRNRARPDLAGTVVLCLRRRRHGAARAPPANHAATRGADAQADPGDELPG